MTPRWGVLAIDHEALAALDLPSSMQALVQRRVDDLSHAARSLLEAAAILGSQCALPEAQRVSTLSDTEWRQAVDEAIGSHLIEALTHGTYGFVHERTREVLLAALPPEQRRVLHRRAADEREARSGAAPTLAAAREIADHLEACGDAVPVRRRILWHRAAGERALDEMAFALADHHLSAARTLIAEHGQRVDADLHEASARALLGLGEMPDATQAFDAALAASTDAHQRARILLTRSQMRFSAYDAIGSFAAATDGLAALGWRRPRSRMLFALQVCAHAIIGLVLVGRRRVGHLPDGQRERVALQVNLLRAAGQARYLLLQPMSATAYTLLSLPWAARLGPSRELAQAMSIGAVVAATFGADGLRGRLIEGARRVGEHIGDPGATAYAAMHDALSLEAAGRNRASGEAARGLLTVHGSWLETSDLMLLAGAIAWNLDVRGHTREALQQWQLVYDRSRLASEAGAAENPYLLMGWITLESLGMRSEAAALRAQVSALGEETTANRYRRQAYLGALVRYLRDQGDYGPEMTQAIAGLDALKLNPATINPWAQPAFTQPYDVAVERACRATDPGERATWLAEARQRRRVLRRMRLLPMLQATMWISDARVARLDGKPARASRLLARAERVAIAEDMPRAHSDIAEVRAQLASEPRRCRRDPQAGAPRPARGRRAGLASAPAVALPPVRIAGGRRARFWKCSRWLTGRGKRRRHRPGSQSDGRAGRLAARTPHARCPPLTQPGGRAHQRSRRARPPLTRPRGAAPRGRARPALPRRRRHGRALAPCGARPRGHRHSPRRGRLLSIGGGARSPNPRRRARDRRR